MDDFRTPEDLFKKRKKNPPNGNDIELQQIKKYLIPGIALLLILTALRTMVYSIEANEVGVIQRFGAYTRTVDPGLHVKIPFGIEKVTPVKVKKIFKEEFGFRTLEAGVKTRYSKKNYLNESLMLTGDLNILDVRWIVQFKVKDPIKLLFEAKDPVENVRDMSEVVMTRLAGDYMVDELLTTKREEVGIRAQEALQDILDRYKTGIKIVTVKLQDVNPPQVVKPAFNEVNEAKQEKERMINEAREEYNKIIPRAKGEALRTISQAEGFATDRVNRAEGDADRFTKTWTEYQKAPIVTKKRIYLETMGELLPGITKKIIIDSSQKGILPLLDLNKQEGALQ